MQPWHLPDTYSLVKAAHGREQEQLVSASVRSVVDRKAFAAYHVHEALRLHRTFERRHLSGKLLLDLHTQEGDKQREAFEVLMVKAGAHSLAAIQSVHSLTDLLAHAVYFATGQNLQPTALPERGISIGEVGRLLRKNSQYSALQKHLGSATAGKGWRHLAAVCNVSKHKNVVRASLSEDWTGKRKNFRELHISSFERDEVAFPAVSLQELIAPEYDRLSLVILAVGHELNSALRADAA